MVPARCRIGAGHGGGSSVSLLLSVSSLLTDPNFADPLNNTAAALFRQDPKSYDSSKRARKDKPRRLCCPCRSARGQAQKGLSPADMQRGCPLADMQGDCPLADLQGEPYIGMSPISLNCRLCAFHNRGRGNTDLVDIQSILVGRLHTRSMGRRSNESNLDHLAYFVLSAIEVVAAATLVELNAFWRADCTLGR